MSDYIKTNWQEGITPLSPSNMNKIETGIDDAHEELTSHLADTLHDKGSNIDFVRCYAENVKTIALFQADEAWGGYGNSSADTTNYKIGTQSVKLIQPNAVAEGKYIDRAATLDLSKFQDGSNVNSTDFIRLLVYIQDVAKVTSVGLQFFNTGYTKYYTANKTTGLVTGWNFIDFLISDFTTGNGMTWDIISYVRANWGATATAQNYYVSFQSIQLVRKDPLSAIPNSFQQKVNGVYERIFAINSGFWFLGLEFGEVVCRDLQNNATVKNALLGVKVYSDFIIGSTQIVNTVSNFGKLVWYIDASNYVMAYYYNDSMGIESNIAGVTTYTETAISSVLAIGSKIDINFRKNGSSVIFKITINGGIVYEISKEVTLTGNGYLAIGTQNTKQFTIKSLSITTVEHADHANVADWAKSVGKGTWEIIETKTLIANQTQVDFLNISPDWKYLKLLFTCKSSLGTVRDLCFRENDVAQWYTTAGVKVAQTTPVPLATTNVAQFTLPDALSTSSGISSCGEILWNNLVSFHAAYAGYGSVIATYIVDGWANPGGAIKKLSLFASADQICAGSKFILMGVK